MPRSLTAAVGAALAALLVAACGSSHTARVAPAARLVTAPGGSGSEIVLSAVGAQRIGLATAPARHAKATAAGRFAAQVIVPASAIIYDPSGRTYAFVALGRLTFTEIPVIVNRISGNSAYLRSGPRAGARVVSTGAEELFGVQTGVLGQT
jgi:hypothetical protein